MLRFKNFKRVVKKISSKRPWGYSGRKKENIELKKKLLMTAFHKSLNWLRFLIELVPAIFQNLSAGSKNPTVPLLLYKLLIV